MEAENFIFDVEFERGSARSVLHAKSPVVLKSFALNHVEPSGTRWRIEKVLTYDEQTAGRSIPTKVVESRQIGSELSVRTTLVTKAELGAQPLELFSLEAQGYGMAWVWVRRIMIVCVGLGLFGAYLAYRRKKRE